MNTYELAHAVWQAGFIKDKNKIKRQAKYEALRLVASCLSSALKKQNPDFDQDDFINKCYVSY